MSESSTEPGDRKIGHRDAIRIAKEYVREVFSGEGISDPTLEEIWLDEGRNEWVVTVGFFLHLPRAIKAIRQLDPTTYKTVRISADTGKPLSIKLYHSAA